jgi:hypothetical protein
MPVTTTYPDGSQLVSSALTKNQIELAMQIATCQMLGILTGPWNAQFTLTTGLATAVVLSTLNLYPGQLVACAGVPTGTTILSIAGDVVTFSNAATATGAALGSVTDPLAPQKVRIAWQQQGQPGPAINADTCFVRCTPVDADFSRTRDLTSPPGNIDDTTVTQNDVFTRAWRTFWTFYGPNGVDNARAVRSALIKIQIFADLLATNNLYVNPSIAEPMRVPEDFQGEWWERVDLAALFNEQVTESYIVNAVASVEVIGYTVAGEFIDTTVVAP